MFDYVATDNTCEFGPLVGDAETEYLLFDEVVADDGYISDGEITSVYAEDGTYLADAILLWPDLYFDYFVDPDWSISYFIEFLSATDASAEKTEFFSDVICSIVWAG
ncbi:MAG: hypothetical protein GTN93_04010 [Anaerolineae bacterium]|nr:hypothetical protein [Anaerolineae bacterium]